MRFSPCDMLGENITLTETPCIRVDRNCQPTWVTQNAIPEEQELILLGAGVIMIDSQLDLRYYFSERTWGFCFLTD